MGIKRVFADVGSESPKEDYPWRPIPMGQMAGSKAPYGITTTEEMQNQGILINPASCLMGGLDVTAKIPICGLGIPFILSELDFVWLAVYFDTNLRPIHAGIQKGPRHTRWYEYGGISMGGFPRNIKTVRRDHIGVDIGAVDANGWVVPDVFGPEYDYVGHEVDKEIEHVSPYGFLNGQNTFMKPGAWDNMKKALRSELTFYLLDPVQVKQFAAYTLLGYCTSTPPDAKYPYPHTVHEKISAGKSIKFYYRQTATTHLMLQEVNAGGVRACHIVPGFSPYIEAIPHPHIDFTPDPNPIPADRVGGTLHIRPADGVIGTLPPIIMTHMDAQVPPEKKYKGGEKAHGDNWLFQDAPNVKARMPLPGENATPTRESQGVLGWAKANLWFMKFGAKYGVVGASHPGLWEFKTIAEATGLPVKQGGAAGGGGAAKWDIELDCDSIQFYMSKERCMDSRIITISRQGTSWHYEQETGEALDLGWPFS
jgi:hypothetical protein